MTQLEVSYNFEALSQIAIKNSFISRMCDFPYNTKLHIKYKEIMKYSFIIRLVLRDLWVKKDVYIVKRR